MKHLINLFLAVVLFATVGCTNQITPPVPKPSAAVPLPVESIGISIKPDSSTIYSPWKWTNNGLPSQELTNVTDGLKSPEQIADYLQKNVSWLDNYDTTEFLSPNQVIADKRTVCTGFARFWNYSLARNGYTSHFIAVWGPNSAHAFTVFQYQGNWRLGSNQYYYGAFDKNLGVVGKDYLETAAINGAIEFYGKYWQRIQIFTESGHIIQEINNTVASAAPMTPGSETRTVFNIKR